MYSNFCQSKEISLEELKNCIKNQLDAVNPIWMKYQVQTTYTSDYFNRLAKNPNAVNSEKNVTFDTKMEWAQKGDKLRFSCIAPRLYHGKIVEQPKEDIYVFDGNLVINNPSEFYLNDKEGYPLYNISSDKTYAQVYETPFAFSGGNVFYRVLSEFNPETQSYSIETLIEDDNSKIIHLSINNPKYSEQTSIWLRDNPYFTVKKIEFISGNSKYILEDIIYEIIDEVPIPVAGKKTRLLNGKLLSEKTMKVNFYEIRGNKISNSLFTMKIPQNVVVQNMDTGKSLVDTSIIKNYLDSIPLWKRPSFWLLGCVNLIFIGIIIYSCRNNIKLLFTKKT
jgi:outer membrane lipoprotein-sorting protein